MFTCFKANPRRRPNESVEDVKDRKALGLCVNAGDRVRLLNPDVWPDSIRVSDWFFSNRNSQQSNRNVEKRQCMERSDEPEPTVSSHGSVGINSNNNVGVNSVNNGNTGVARETATAATVTVVGTDEAMTIDTTSNESCDDNVADDDGDRTTIYQHGASQ